MKVNILSNKISWFGKYSGYECLPEYFNGDIEPTINIAQYNIYNKLVGKFYKVRNGLEHRSEDILNEVRFLRKAKNFDVSHILYLESHLDLVPSVRQKCTRLIGTIHLPFSQWNKVRLQKLSPVNNAILLYNEEVELFSKYIPKENLHVIKHGVDIDFFKPGDPALVKKNKVLFVGHFLRNFEMMDNVVDKIAASIKDTIEYHFIIPSAFRMHPVLVDFLNRPNVFFHEKLSDEELLEQYQTSYVMLMPMLDSGANTAIVQALSVGLPIITTDTGGIRSYGGGSVFEVINNNDSSSMTALFARYFNDEGFRNEISAGQRSLATEHLDWRLIAKQHASIYKNL